MCGRYTLTKPIKTIRSHFKPARISLKYFPSFNIAPSQISAVVTQKSEVVGMKWGLVPSWAKNNQIGSKLINARSETINEKPSFRDSLENQRCLVPADGFIEWKGRKPYYIRFKDHRLFAFAGLWSAWGSGEKPLHSYTIITTEADKTLYPIHSRMPVILHPKNYEKWFFDDINSFNSLFTTPKKQELEYFEISTAINFPKNNEANLLQPFRQNSFTF
ncbi:MAG: SOS response-associated peptidase [Nitrospinota bacterium]|nr:SOS response-associated peptidase [Nitrospinota bacterium]